MKPSQVTLMVFVLGSCFTVNPRDSRSASEERRTFLDTLNRGKELALTERDFAGGVAPGATGARDSAGVASDGFRIQIMASSTEETVRVKKGSVEREFEYPAYIDFDEPYYKLYIGNFKDRAAADKALAKIRQAGYPDAWIVKSKIFFDE